MHRRIAAQLLTGPLAFLLAGVIDVLAFAVARLRARARARVRGAWRPVRREAAARVSTIPGDAGE